MCGSFKDADKQRCAHLQLAVAGFLSGLLELDATEPVLERCKGNKYLLVLVDYFTKCCEAIPPNFIDARTIADAVVEKWVCRWDALSQFSSHKRSNFESTLFAEVLYSRGVEETSTTSYRSREWSSGTYQSEAH